MIAGRVWKFGEDINTDLMVPGPVLYSPEPEQMRALFSASRPGWVDLVKQGDIILGGNNFGMGSSRPAARSLRNLGLSCLVADTINGLFFRNAVNFGFLAVSCPGVSAAFTEGQEAEVSIETWTVKNRATGQVLTAEPIPETLLTLMLEGGIYPSLERAGLLAPKVAQSK